MPLPSVDEISFSSGTSDDSSDCYLDDMEVTKTPSKHDNQIEEYQKLLMNTSTSYVSVQTVEDDDDDDDDEYTYDEYTYDEEEIVEVEMENHGSDVDSTTDPPPLPPYRPATTGPGDIETPKAAAAAAVSTPAFTTQIPAETPPISRMTVSPIGSKSSGTRATTAVMTKTTESSSSSSSLAAAAAAAAPVKLSPSQERVRAASSTGLSELSKQLRILQAKNESQSVDINRLERQLRIMADLQGISVSDLRRALEDACASEAFGELQNRVSKLKHELEWATLSKQAELRKETTAPHIANLELRVGELEELEEKQAEEIRTLYENLRREKARATRLESEHQPLKKALQGMIQRFQSETARAAQMENDYRKQLQDLREQRSRELLAEADRGAVSERGGGRSGSSSSLSGSVSQELAADYERMVQLLKKQDAELRELKTRLREDETKNAEQLRAAEEHARKARTDATVELSKLALTVKELEEADDQNGLKLAQYKARFCVQDDRIEDMGQQLDSLYTAFTLLSEEFDSEKERRAAMMDHLRDADAEIARHTKRQEEEHETQGRGRGGSGSGSGSRSGSGTGSRSGSSTSTSRHPNHGFPPSSSGNRSSTPPRFGGTSSDAGGNSRSIVVSRAPVSPMTPSTNRDYLGLTNTTNDYRDSYAESSPSTYAIAQPFLPPPIRTPSTWELLRSNDNDTDTDNRDRMGDRDPWMSYSPDSARLEPEREQTAEERYDYRHPADQDFPENLLISGPLIVKGNGVLRVWKTRQSRIFLRGQGYQWNIGYKMSFPLQFGISKVEFHPNHPLSFTVYIDPSSDTAPVIRAAAVKERDYHRWMTALYKATTGEEYLGREESVQTPSRTSGGSGGRSSRQLARRDQVSRQVSSRSAGSNNSAMEDQDDEDLKRVLELSKRYT